MTLKTYNILPLTADGSETNILDSILIQSLAEAEATTLLIFFRSTY